MDNIDLMMSAVKLIENNLTEEISVTELAAKIGYSVFYFSRLFHALTGHTPSDYLNRRRIYQSAAELRDSDRKVIDIALDYQFNNPESYTRAFKRVTGYSPTQWRKHRDLAIPEFKPLDEKNLRHLQRIIDYRPDKIERDGFSVVGMQIKVTAETTYQITDLWNRFFKGLPGIPNRIEPERTYEIGYVPESFEPDAWMMMCALEVSSIDTVGLSYVAKTIPAARYLRFVHRGLSRDVGLTYRYIFQTYLPQSEYRLGIPYLFEYYGDAYYGPDDPNSESEIYIPIELI